MSAPKVGALFAGYGGLELAVREVFPAASPAWVAEFDAAPSRILAQRFPGVPNLGDVTQVDWASLEPVDIITGGSPCQDLSHAGKRAGMRAETRSGLWASMCDAIEIIRPRLVVWENVRGALSAEADSAVEPCPICVGDGRGVSLRALGRVLGDLAELGYDAAWVGLRAADVGAPHGRFRVFVLAWPADAASEGLEAWREGRPGGGVGLGGRGADLTLLPSPRTSDTNGAGMHGDGGLDLRTAVSLLPTPQAMDTAGAMDDRRSTSGYGPALRDIGALLPTPVTEPTTGNGHARNLGGEIRALLPTPTATDRKASGAGYATTDTHHTGTTLTDATVRQPERFGIYAPAIARWEAVLGRPAPAPTEPTGKGGAHRLSPRFVEWMQGLPDGWVTDTDTTRNEQLKALGNGVVPQQAAAAIRHLLGVRAAALAGMEAVA